MTTGGSRCYVLSVSSRGLTDKNVEIGTKEPWFLKTKESFLKLNENREIKRNM